MPISEINESPLSTEQIQCREKKDHICIVNSIFYLLTNEIAKE